MVLGRLDRVPHAGRDRTDSGFRSSAVVETSTFAKATADRMLDKSGHQPGAGHWKFGLAIADLQFVL